MARYAVVRDGLIQIGPASDVLRSHCVGFHEALILSPEMWDADGETVTLE